MFIIKGKNISDSLAASLLLLAVAVYSIQRVISSIVSEPDEKCSTVNALQELVAKRETELAEGLPHEGYTSKVVINERVGENYEMQIPEAKSESQSPESDSEGG